jgi:hypothetical protein
MAPPHVDLARLTAAVVFFLLLALVLGRRSRRR